MGRLGWGDDGRCDVRIGRNLHEPQVPPREGAIALHAKAAYIRRSIARRTACGPYGPIGVHRPGRRGCYHPRPPQTRACGFPASGSSRERFARGRLSQHPRTRWSRDRALARSAIHPLSLRSKVHGTRSPPIPANGSSNVAPPFLRRIPVACPRREAGSPVPQLQRYMRVLRLPASAFPVFYVFTSRLHAAPRLLRVSPWRSWRTRGCPPGQEICSTGFPVPVPSPAWANTGSHRFPGDPSRIFPPAPNPGRIRAASPWRSPRCCPRLKGRRRLPRVMISWPLSRGFSTRCLRFTSVVA